ncbi:ABC transporter substrate-binding protein [Thalassovita sp.]|jgi:branched-chain amino acid transport system substrate-binding protein|uniref:ABC transporter substrate-binding protein n=1 Tax=Thalassovita sp. TaxID=1979401 RepID=UPI003B5C35E3
MTKSNIIGISRRSFNQLLGSAVATASVPAFASRAFASAEDTLRIGFVGPRSGPLGVFGEGDNFLIDKLNANMANGLTINGKTYAVKVVLGDTQSNPVRASQVTKDMINGDNIDLMITSSTPETVNPVADACEAAGMPCLSTTAPWEAFYFGRGGVPGEKTFKWTYHFCFGTSNFVTLYTDQWSQIETNKKVGVLLPSDADGNAIRAGLVPALADAGWDIVDPGPYENMSADFSKHIKAFKDSGVEIVNTFPFPPDFPVFWRQAAQQGLAAQTKIMQMAKAGLFAAELEAMGPLGYGLHAGAYWHPSFPFSSPALGLTSAEIAAGYEKTSGKQWNQQVGATASLLDAAIAALAASGAPKDKAAVAAALGSLKCDTAVGPIDFAAGAMGGAVANACETHLVGAQWNKAEKGPWDFQLDIVSNADHPAVPTTAPMTAYKLPG